MPGIISRFNFEPQAYHRPPEGWPVVVLSDLGIGSRMSAPATQEWRAFADLVKSTGCRLDSLGAFTLGSLPCGDSFFHGYPLLGPPHQRAHYQERPRHAKRG